MCLRGGRLGVVNYYSPCQGLELGVLERVEGQVSCKVLWCGDFNLSLDRRKWQGDGGTFGPKKG